MSQDKLNQITSFCKRKGFVFPSSDIYGGFSGFYDYGPYGAQLLRNLKNLWWKNMVQDREDIVGLDGAILMHPKAWEASGHVSGFTDPLVDCPHCKGRFRPDKLPGWEMVKNNKGQWIAQKVGDRTCPSCGKELGTEIRQFNVLMETSVGVIEGEKKKAYLKGESCQNIYLDFINVFDSLSPKFPFGIAQIGKAFRNEITLGKFLFKTREFEQWDVEYFVRPENADKVYKKWKEIRWQWFTEKLKINPKNLQWRQHAEHERIFYATDAWDINYQYPWGWDEIEGIHHRGDYDLTQHGKFSRKDLSVFDPETKQKILPYIIETSGGVGRSFFALLLENYHEETVDNRSRIYLSLPAYLAPVQTAVLPLVKNDEKLTQLSQKIYQNLKKEIITQYDQGGTIGRRYRRQDEIGTPFCLTIDKETLENDTVTLRHRDSMEQERIKIDEISNKIIPAVKLP